MSRRALITGVSGFAGRHLARALVGQGWAVTGTVRSRRSGVDGVDERRVDVADWEGLRRLVSEIRPDAVFHLAAVVDTVTTPDLAVLYQTNTIGTAALLDAVLRTSCSPRVLVASSAFAYGRVTAAADRISEGTPLVPVTPYGASKAATEAIALQWWRQTGIDLVVARGFQHTGPGHVGRYALAEWARELAGGAEALEVGNLDVVRDYLDVRDVATAYAAMLEAGRPGEVYNVGSGVGRSMREMLDGLLRAFDREVEIRPSPLRFRVTDQQTFVADVAKLRTDLGWAPRYEMRQTLADLAAGALGDVDRSSSV